MLYDAVAILTSAEGADRLKTHPAALDFIGDAYAHRKFIAWAPDADALMTEAGVAPPKRDAGFVKLGAPSDAPAFLKTCRDLRFWAREKVIAAV